ncbi:hypothetical protein CVT24_000919 [Panaeolus cyanescens]|uniref:DUF726-domain-containing protein n=1 Tax=Panaeolus cyanescens TaxID=181874 RepID=A0A409YT95_9AGAR|nr:hypothetical protein CVT24_000919 [Panaeolus cyanescens]
MEAFKFKARTNNQSRASAPSAQKDIRPVSQAANSTPIMPPISSFPPPKDIFDDDDDDGWQDMPIVREDTSLSGLDEEDLKKYHYQPSAKGTTAANATGNLIDVDDLGNEWRSKIDQNESEYTRLRGIEDDDVDEVHLRTKYLFDEDKAMTPLSQMQATKNLLTEAQRIAYVGLCALTSREMLQSLQTTHRKELKAAIANMELWAMKIMGRLYYHMELETQEQKMIESLAEHGVLASDLVPALMTTHTVANPEYDPEEARRKAEEDAIRGPATVDSDDEDDKDAESISGQTLVEEPEKSGEKTPTRVASPVQTLTAPPPPDLNTLSPSASMKQVQVTQRVLQDTSTAAMPGVTTSLSSTDEKVTLDIRWTVLCDLFLILIADSVYDARSRVLLEQVALKLGLGWLDVVKFESRVSQALEIQEDVETLEQTEIVEGAKQAGKKRRYMMLGLATLGGGLVIGLSAGLLAPVIGLGLAGALTTVGVTGTGAFLGGTAGAAVITTGGVLTGSGIAVKGMVKRTQQVRTFEILPLHNNKRVNCILTVPGFMNGINDDVRLPFSVLDPIVGDVFSVLWEPEMIRETGSALKILTGEVLSQVGMTVLQATVMAGLMSALQWPIILTKLGYLIDNPWSNALDRAKGAGKVLAETLIQRHLGVRPITLIGFSLGARVIFYALLELAKQKQFGIVQDVFLMGATLTVSQSMWCETRSVVSGRYVNAFARNDWVLNYLFRATSGGVGTVAGLRPVENVPGLENVDVTDKIAGHMSYRTFMPLILDQLGFPVFSDFFDEPEEPDFSEDRIVVREEDQKKSSGWFSRKKTSTSSTPQKHVQRPPSAATFAHVKRPSQSSVPSNAGAAAVTDVDDDLPPRLPSASESSPPKLNPADDQSGRTTPTPLRPASESTPELPMHAGFDLTAIKNAVQDAEIEQAKASPVATSSTVPTPQKKGFFGKLAPPPVAPPTHRSQSTPPALPLDNEMLPRSASFEYPGTPSKNETIASLGLGSSSTPSTPYSRSFSSGDVSSRTDHLPSSSYRKTSLATTSFPEDESQLSSSSFGNFPTPTVHSLSLGLPDDAIPSWGSSSFSNTPSNKSAFSSLPSTATFGSSPSTTSSPPMYNLPSSLANPFTSYAESLNNASTNLSDTKFGNSGVSSIPALSFGSPDGDITAAKGSAADSWTIPPLGSAKRKGSTPLDSFSANPWS